MAAISTIALVGAAVIGGVSAIKQGQAANARSKFEANVLRQQAEREGIIAQQAERDFRLDSSAALAQRRAALGASGVRGDTGSPVLAEKDFLNEVELQSERIRAGGATNVTRLEQQAILTRKAGANAQTRGQFRAGSSLLSGAATAFG